MNIKYQPEVPAGAESSWQKGHTNTLGEFWPGEVKVVSPGQEEYAASLIANGEFAETDEDPNSDEIAAAIGGELADGSDESDGAAPKKKKAKK